MEPKLRSRFFVVAMLLLVSLCLLSLVVLFASQVLSFRTGSLRQTSKHEMSLRYGTFTASEEKQQVLAAGNVLLLDYDVVVSKGTLTVSVLDPSGSPVWDVTLREDAEARARIPIAESGVYTIRFRGDETGGRTRLSWKIAS